MKRGQMELSFGMIFSIILIIVFIGFAFYAIYKFVGLQDSIKIAQFGESLQSDIDKMWKSSQGSQKVEYVLPSEIESVCFRDNEYSNLIFSSEKFRDGKNIQHIDIKKIIGEENKFCIENIKGKVKMIIKKDYGESLVTITKQ